MQIQDLIEKDENVQNIEKQAEERRSAIARLKQSVERIQRELDGLQAEVDEEPEGKKHFLNIHLNNEMCLLRFSNQARTDLFYRKQEGT